MISHNKKFIFIHPHRTGGSSVELTLKKYSDSPIIYRQKYGVSDLEAKHENIPNLIKNNFLTEEEYNEFFKIAIVRNPWDRAISWYFWRLKLNKDEHSEKLLKKTSGEHLFDKDTFKVYQTTDKPYKLPRLVDDLIGIDGKFDKSIYDCIIHTETIQEDLDNVCDVLNIPRTKLFPYTVYPYGGTKHDYFKTYYNEELKQLVENVYGEDIKQFEYKW